MRIDTAVDELIAAQPSLPLSHPYHPLRVIGSILERLVREMPGDARTAEALARVRRALGCPITPAVLN